jgi:hypothetical protein
MALYVPRFAGCFGAACDDIFPTDAPSGAGPISLPGFPPISFPSPGVNVDLAIAEGRDPRLAPGPCGLAFPGGPGSRSGSPSLGSPATEGETPWLLQNVDGIMVAVGSNRSSLPRATSVGWELLTISPSC